MSLEPANSQDFLCNLDPFSLNVSPEMRLSEISIPETANPTLVRESAQQPVGTDEGTTEASELSPLVQRLVQILLAEFQAELPALSASMRSVVTRIVMEVERVCSKSDRIQSSGQVQNWQLTLTRHRLKKCVNYYRLGSRRGRVDLHTHLSTMVYRHIVASQAQMGFSARYGVIEDFMQGFYIEVLKAFRREHNLGEDYSPRTRLELAEYMAFTEHYAKRRITLPGRRSQQLIVLRAQGFAHRQPPETTLDLELAVEAGKGEEAELQSRSSMMQQVREQMVSEAVDPSDSVVRDRVINELAEYLESQGQTDCVNYLSLKLQDLSAPEIDELMGGIICSSDLSTMSRSFRVPIVGSWYTSGWVPIWIKIWECGNSSGKRFRTNSPRISGSCCC
jgi:hypothetical protein